MNQSERCCYREPISENGFFVYKLSTVNKKVLLCNMSETNVPKSHEEAHEEKVWEVICSRCEEHFEKHGNWVVITRHCWRYSMRQMSSVMSGDL